MNSNLLSSLRAASLWRLARSLLVVLLALQLLLPYPVFADEGAGAVETSVVQAAQTVEGGAATGTSAASVAAATATQDLVINSVQNYIHDFGVSGALKISGDLINQGTIYAISTNPAVTSAVIEANNIFNASGGLITTVLPAGGLAGYENLVSNLNLVLQAVQDIVNAGTISSAGNLSVIAGGSVINAGAAGAPSAVMQAVNNLSVQAATMINQGILASQLANLTFNTASINNTGVIQAAAGSVNIANLMGTGLDIQNLLGTISAAQQISFQAGSTADPTGAKSVLSVLGGTLSAPEIAFFIPQGLVKVNADRIDGGVSVSAGVAEIGAALGDLRISSMSLTGDPIYYAGGNLDLSGLFASGLTFSSAGEDFVALAGGDIIAPLALSGSQINGRNAVFLFPGGNITLAAGVDFTITGSTSCADCTSSYSINAPSSTGGSIVLPAVDLVTNSKTISLQAHSGTLSAGTISVGRLETIGGMGIGEFVGGSGGAVNVVADGSITSGAIRTFGGGGGGAFCCSISGSAGGNGGAVNLQSLTGSVSVLGDINTSGGGGGGAAGGGMGGRGGDAGAINILAAGDFSALGPILAVGGGGGTTRFGGGSFGGGGGGGEGGAGGGGLYGGGGLFVGCCDSGGGGSWEGGRGAPLTYNGTAGRGGDGMFGPGGVFGVGGNNQNLAGMAGAGAAGGAAGAGGTINITAGSVAVSGTVESQYAPLSSLGANPFSASPYKLLSVAGGTVNITSQSALAAPATLAGDLAVASSATLSSASGNNSFGLSYIGSHNGAAQVSAGAGQGLTLGNINFINPGGALQISADGDLQIGSVSRSPFTIYEVAPNLSLSSNGGSVETGDINLSGAGGRWNEAGRSAGNVDISAHGNVQTGSIRVFGGGGAGASCCSMNGFRGGDGGSVTLSSTTGGVTVQGDINTSGGGGGGGSGGGVGGDGGAAGEVNIQAAGAFVATGPILAIGGGGGTGDEPGYKRAGGGSLGGGGGGGDGGAGGGGFYGGGGSVGAFSGGGGGVQGGGTGSFLSGSSGSAGAGGSGNISPTQEDPMNQGGIFGIGGASQNVAGSSGYGLTGGAAGASARVRVAASTIEVNGDVASYYGGIAGGNQAGFASSPFNDFAIAGGNIDLLPVSQAQDAVKVSGRMSVGDTITIDNRVTLENPLLAYTGNPGGTFTVNGIAGQSLSLADIVFLTAPSVLRVNADGDIAIGNVTRRDASVTDVIPTLEIVSINGGVAIGNVDLTGLGGTAVDTRGGHGGNLSITAYGDITTGFLRTYGGGGAGGHSFAAPGGDGGNGGYVTLVSQGGNVLVNGDINTSGGGGGGGAGGTFVGGHGGAGGDAGSVFISAKAHAAVLGPILAAGGGGGAGDSRNDGDVFYRSGGGSFGGGGAGGDGGAGGGGFYGGGGSSNFAISQGGGRLGGGLPGTPFGGGDPSVFGEAGELGRGGDGISIIPPPDTAMGGVFGVGGDGQNIVGEIGSGNQAGAAGQFGDVTISGCSVTLEGTVASHYAPLYGGSSENPFLNSPFADISTVGATVTINTTCAEPTSTVYSSDANYSTASANFAAQIEGEMFTVGQLPGEHGSGSLGGIWTSQGAIINSTNTGLVVTGGSYEGPAELTIIVDGVAKTVSDGQLITPAEWIAVIQVSQGTQTLVLDSTGNASGGTFEFASENIPTGGFTSLVLPQDVVATATVDELNFSGTSTIAGSLIFSSGGTLTTTGLSVTNTGSLSSAGASSPLTITGSSGQGTFTVVNDGSISASGLLTVLTPESLSISGSGQLSGPSGISLVSTSGFVSAIQGAASGAVGGSAATDFVVETTGGGLQVGSITANDGSVDLTTGGGALHVVEGAVVQAIEGNLILNNLDASNGTISIGAGATLSAESSVSEAAGDIYIFLGPTVSLAAGTAPDDLSVTLLNYGEIFYGSQGISTECCDNTAVVDGSAVVFDTGGGPASSISLGGDVTILATSPNSGGSTGGGGGSTGGGGGSGSGGTGSCQPPHGHGGSPPGQEPNTEPPGLCVLPPGLGGDNPSTEDGQPPGLKRTPPGQAGDPPGHRGEIPGLDSPSPSLDHSVQNSPSVTSVDATPPDNNYFANGNQGSVAPSAKGKATAPGQLKKVSYQDGDSDEPEFVPVSFVHPGAGRDLSTGGVETAKTSTATIKHAAGSADVYTSVRTGTILVRHGEVLVAADKPTVVKLDSHTVAMEGGTMALISTDGSVARVCALWESGNKSIKVYAGKQHLPVYAGQEIIIGADEATLSRAVSGYSHGRRRGRSIDLASGQAMSQCEISPVSLIRNTDLLTLLTRSSDRGDRAISEKLVKMAACIMQSTASHGAYSRHRL